jgi:nitrite reductase (NADH) large subunit
MTNNHMENIVILGGGVAGTSAAEDIRKANAEVSITIIEQEHHPLYSRVLLPHYVKGKVLREKVFLKTWEWYADQRIDIMPGVRVEAIDTKNRFVTTSEGRELPFDVLILAGGGELNMVGGEPRGTSYLRGVDDADELLALVKETKMRPAAEQRGVVIGGGFIALEYINIFAHYGIACDVVIRGNGFWSQVLSEHAQEILAAKAVAGGVTLHVNEREPELLGEKGIEGVKLHDGTVLPAAIVGVGIGMHPDQSFYREAGFDVDRGILTNEYFETKHSNVYAIGDGAEFFDQHVGRGVCYGNWMNAQMQGRVVAKTILGNRVPFDLVSSYTTNLLSLQMVFIGDVDRAAADDVKQIFATAESSGEEYYRNGKLVGATLIGDVAQRAAITARIRENSIERTL